VARRARETSLAPKALLALAACCAIDIALADVQLRFRRKMVVTLTQREAVHLVP
jgi:hypothetical protein